jgi:hypothetical protein
MTNSQELAIGAIRTIYDLWKIDTDCVHWVGDTSAKTILSEGYGFYWWPGDFKVEVRVSGPHPEIDYPLYRLSVRTDFLCDVDVTTVKSQTISFGPKPMGPDVCNLCSSNNYFAEFRKVRPP